MTTSASKNNPLCVSHVYLGAEAATPFPVPGLAVKSQFLWVLVSIPTPQVLGEDVLLTEPYSVYMTSPRPSSMGGTVSAGLPGGTDQLGVHYLFSQSDCEHPTLVTADSRVLGTGPGAE